MNWTNQGRSRRPKNAGKRLYLRWNIIPRLLALESRDVPTAFTPGDLVLVREGSNSDASNLALGFTNNLPSPSAPIYLDEYTPSGTLVQTVAMPNLANVGLAGNLPINFDPSNGSGNGQISLSADSSVLTFAGDAVSPGTSDTNTKNAQRVIAQIGIDPAAAGGINTQLNGLFGNTDDDRAVVEANPNTLYVVTHSNGAGLYGGVRYLNGISTIPNNGVQTSTNANARGVTVGFDGKLYWTTGSPTGVYTQQDALPTALQPSDVKLFANPTGGEKLDGLFLADMNGDGVLDAGDRMYYTGLISGMDVSVYDGTTWGTPVSIGNPAGTNLIGLTGEVVTPLNGPNGQTAAHVVLFGTTYPGTAGTNSLLVRYDDVGAIPSSSSATQTTVLTLPTTSGLEGYRGVSFAPMSPTLISLTSSTHATTPGTAVTFNGTVTNAAGSLAGMTVNLIDNGTTLLAQPVVQANGSISFTTSTLPLGTNNVTLEYVGNYSGSTPILPQALSSAISVNITGSNVSQTALTSAPNPSTSGLAVTFTATVSGSMGTPTGTVTFTADGANVLGTATLSGGTASVTFSALTVGSHPVTVFYSGDATYQASNGALASPQQVNAGATIAITSSNISTTPGGSVTFTATVTGNGQQPAPTGTVTFYSDGQVIGGGPVTLVGNQAQLPPLTTLTAGSHLITATFNGDSTYGPVTSAQLIENVKQAFAQGDLVVLRMGDYATSLGSGAAQVYLDEYTPAGTLVQSIAMPNIDSGTTHILSLSGSGEGSGALSLSANGQYLTFTGIDAVPGTPVVTSTDPATTPRTIARIDSNTIVDTSTTVTIPDGQALGSVFGATSNDGKEFWIGGDGSAAYSGLEYTTLGSSGTPTSMTMTSSGFRSPTIYNGQLYSSSGSSATPIVKVGTGLPTTVSTLTGLPGVADMAGGITDPRQFLLFNTPGTTGQPNLMYIADLNEGILKYYFDGTNWNYVGDKLDFAGGVTGITGTMNPTTGVVTLYGTGSKTSQGAAATNYFTLTDDAPANANFPSGNVSELATVAAIGEAFRGIAFVPAPAAPSVAAVQVNNGAAQRSEVRSLTVTFSGPVAFAGGNAAAAFQLQHVQDSTNVANLAAAVSTNANGETVVTLTFTTTGNAATEIDPVSAENGGAPSLADGRFQLTIFAANITDANSGLALNGGANFVSPTDTNPPTAGQLDIYRLFGDATGNGIVDQLDLAQFRAANNSSSPSPAYVAFLDADNSGTIDQIDLAQFRQRNNSSVFPMTPGATPLVVSTSAPVPLVGQSPLAVPSSIVTPGPTTLALPLVPGAPDSAASVADIDGHVQWPNVRSTALTFSAPVSFGEETANGKAATVGALGWAPATPTFSRAEGASLRGKNGGTPAVANGPYQLHIPAGSTTGDTAAALNGGSNKVSPTDTLTESPGQLHLSRLFGDINGSVIVDPADLGQLRSALDGQAGDPLYLSFLDADNGGGVYQVELGQS